MRKTLEILLGAAIMVACTPKDDKATNGEELQTKYAALLTAPRVYDCMPADGKIVIDGRLNDKAWEAAPQSEEFVDISGYDFPTPAQSTWVKMLYDDEYLYIGARLNEKNIVGDLTQRDTIIWRNNDFEVFLDPDGDGVNYFEFENNALGTLMDLLLEKPYRSGGSFFLPWDCQRWNLKVAYEGTLNDTTDVDQAWTVEMAIPFAALQRDFKDPRDFKVWRINFSRVEWPVPGQKEENWVWSPTGKVDMHMPERWGYLRFVDKEGNVPQTEINQEAYNLLWTLFYAEKDYQTENGRYFTSVNGLNLNSKLPVDIEATSKWFDLSTKVDGKTYSLNSDGRFTVSDEP